MTRTLFAAFLMAVLICPLTLAQEVPAKKQGRRSSKGALEEALARALESSPEILLAEARLQQAQAELEQARIKVARTVLQHYAEKRTLQSKLDGAAQQFARTQRLYSKGGVTSQELTKAQRLLVDYKSELASLELMEKYLRATEVRRKTRGAGWNSVIGVGGGAGVGTRSRRGGRTQMAGSGSSAAPVALDKWLDEGLSSAVKAITLEDAVKCVFKGVPEVVCVYDPDILPPQRDAEIAAGKLTRRGALAVLADTFDVVFVYREYGLYITSSTRASAYAPSPTIPGSIPRKR